MRKLKWGEIPPGRIVGAPGVCTVAPKNYFEYELKKENDKQQEYNIQDYHDMFKGPRQ